MYKAMHKFFITSEDDIYDQENSIEKYEFFKKTHEMIKIDDGFIQVLLMGKYLINIPSYDYKKKLSKGLDPLSETTFSPVQINPFLDVLQRFEKEIDSAANITAMGIQKISKRDVKKSLIRLIVFLNKAKEGDFYVYHVGL